MVKTLITQFEDDDRIFWILALCLGVTVALYLYF